MSINAPFQVATDRRCYASYMREGDVDRSCVKAGSREEARREAQERMQAYAKAKASSSNTLWKKLSTSVAVPIRRKISIATTSSRQDSSTQASGVTLLALPHEILDQILHDVGARNFYDEPDRMLVCKRWHAVVQPLMRRHVEVDVNSLLRLIPPTRTSRVKRLLRRNTAGSTSADNNSESVRNACREIALFDADLRVINGFITKNNVPVARGSEYKQWKADIDGSFERLAQSVPEFTRVRSFRLRAWSRDCPIAERRHREWWRLAQETISNLHLRSPAPLDTVELDLCGSAFMWMRCGWMDQSSTCSAVRALLHRVRVLRLRIQCMCENALQIDQDRAGAADEQESTDNSHIPGPALAPAQKLLPRLKQLIINRDTWEANPWSASGPQAGICMRLERAYGPGNLQIVQAMRALVPHMHEPEMVRFIWHDLAFEHHYDRSVSFPLNREGKVAYTGSMAYDLLTERVQRLGFLAPWDAPGKQIAGCPGHLWEFDSRLREHGMPPLGSESVDPGRAEDGDGGAAGVSERAEDDGGPETNGGGGGGDGAEEDTVEASGDTAENANGN